MIRRYVVAWIADPDQSSAKERSLGRKADADASAGHVREAGRGSAFIGVHLCDPAVIGLYFR